MDFSRLLDVDLSGEGNWIERIRSHKVVRLLGFRSRYKAWSEQFPQTKTARNVFEAEASVVARKLSTDVSWIDGRFNVAQIDDLQKEYPVRLDKAVVAHETLNRLLQVANDKVKGFQQTLLGDHCCVCCAFRFPRLKEFMALAVEDVRKPHACERLELQVRELRGKGSEHVDRAEKFNHVLEQIRRLSAANEPTVYKWIVDYLVAKTGQPRTLIDLLSIVKTKKVSGDDTMKLTSASYPTCRALYKVLRRFPSVEANIDQLLRKQLIPLRVHPGPNIGANEYERVEARPVESSDYRWENSKDRAVQWPYRLNMPDHPFAPHKDDDPDDILSGPVFPESENRIRDVHG